jgi:hypothetical protein
MIELGTVSILNWANFASFFCEETCWKAQELDDALRDDRR